MPSSAFHGLDGANHAIPEQSLEFGRFRVLPHQRLLLGDGVPIKSGARGYGIIGLAFTPKHLEAEISDEPVHQ